MTLPEDRFISLGGRFVTSADEIRKKYSSLQAVVFDWDGVFNNGFKVNEGGSSFSEPDSMGVNLMRFNYYLTHNDLIRTFIVTGLSNRMAVFFAKREHFNGIYLNFKNKEEAFSKIRDQAGCDFDRMAFIFDDVLDFKMAEKCALSFLVNRKSSPLTTQYVIDNKICDYITAAPGNEHAVREICELLAALAGKFDETLENRIHYSGIYREYLKKRNDITPVEITGG